MMSMLILFDPNLDTIMQTSLLKRMQFYQVFRPIVFSWIQGKQSRDRSSSIKVGKFEVFTLFAKSVKLHFTMSWAQAIFPVE